MNTNGAINNTAWWQELAGILNGTFDYVVFSIDGLEDTNHIYRKNVVWNKLVENVQAYVNADGSAHWEMLIYQHNEHQIELAEQTARDLGFNWFRTKVSKRFKDVPIKFLNPPNNYQLPNVVQAEKIECYALQEQSIYVSANGRILPCCWFGAEVFSLDRRAQELLADWNLLEASWTNRPHSICSKTCGIDEKGNSFTKQWQIQKQLK
jgi:MoaA/NifB/PqqE/SkfB family radical SAM enzyme